MSFNPNISAHFAQPTTQPRQVDDQMLRISEELAGLEKSVEELRLRLTPILSCPEPPPVDCKDGLEVKLAPLASALRDNRARIRVVVVQIQELIAKLEL